MANNAQSKTPLLSERLSPDTDVVVVVTESQHDGMFCRTVSRVRQFPASLIQAMPARCDDVDPPPAVKPR